MTRAQIISGVSHPPRLAVVSESPGHAAPPPVAIVARLVSIGVVIAVAAMLVQTATHFVNAYVLDGRHAALDATEDGNAFAWLSSVATFAAAFAAAVAAACFARGRRRLLALAAVLAFLSLDDSVALHERLEHVTDTGALVFLAVYLPLLAAAVVLLLGAARRAPASARTAIHGGLALLAFAVAVRAVGGAVAVAGAELPYWQRTIGTGLMQGAELGGWILVAAGLTATLCTRLAARAEP